MADPTEALLQQMQDQIAALQIDLAASSAATLAARNAAAAVTTALAGLPPTGTPNLGTAAPIFALSPAMANAGAFLDLATSAGAKLFKLGAEPLSRSFDFVDLSDLQVFLDLLKTKSKVQ
jgi:Tfp pilus assembly protein FimV